MRNAALLMAGVLLLMAQTALGLVLRWDRLTPSLVLPMVLYMSVGEFSLARGVSVAFVWINSALGLAGLWKATGTLPAALPWWLVAVGVGALLGTQLGIHRLPLKALRYALAAVLLIAAGKLLLG